MRIHVATAALFATLVPAQNPSLTAHPQETLQNNTSNGAPLGCFYDGSSAQSRTMFLVPKDELPSFPAMLTGIEFHSWGVPVSMVYSTLTLNCGPSTATALSMTFASNFPAPPTTVLQGVGLQVNYTGSAWTRIPFTTPYVHDGTSALVIEIQKVVQGTFQYPYATMSTSSSPPRADRPNMIYAFGLPWSTASQAVTAVHSNNPLSFRLVWAGTVPTIRNRSDVGASANQYGLGGTVTLTMNGVAGNLYVMAAAMGFLPVAVPIPSLVGDLRLNGPVVFDAGLLDPVGVATHVMAIPNNPALVGMYIVHQGATVDPVTALITLTNGTDHFINP